MCRESLDLASKKLVPHTRSSQGSEVTELEPFCDDQRASLRFYHRINECLGSIDSIGQVREKLGKEEMIHRPLPTFGRPLPLFNVERE